MDCPKCGVGKLQEVTVPFKRYTTEEEQRRHPVEDLAIDQCFTCNSIWFDAGELKTYLTEDINLVDSPDIDPDLEKTFDRKIAKCPRCQVDMVKKPAPVDKQVIMDHCPRCKGSWLDSGEIDRLEANNLWTRRKTKATIQEIGEMLQRLFRRGPKSS